MFPKLFAFHNLILSSRDNDPKFSDNNSLAFYNTILFLLLDFKNVGEKHKDLKISNESLPIELNENNSKALYSVLEVLDFYKVASNDRTRYEYEKNGVLFEIDDYTNPKAQVVAIEGHKENVDSVYQIIKKLI